jgi:hypothetical protein
VLNSIGVYGFLSRAHIEHALAGDQRAANASATIDARLEAMQADLDGLRARIRADRRLGGLSARLDGPQALEGLLGHRFRAIDGGFGNGRRQATFALRYPARRPSYPPLEGLTQLGGPRPSLLAVDNL